jgi:hypothetical protein
LAVLPVPRIDWITGQDNLVSLVDIPTDLPPSTKMDFETPLPSSSTDHFANIVSESQAWKKSTVVTINSLPVLRVPAQVDQFQLLLVNRPVVLLVQLNVREMEEGKEQVLEYSWMRLKDKYVRMRVLGEPNSFERGAGLGSIAPLRTSRSTTIGRSEEEGKERSVILHGESVHELLHQLVGERVYGHMAKY